MGEWLWGNNTLFEVGWIVTDGIEQGNSEYLLLLDFS